MSTSGQNGIISADSFIAPALSTKVIDLPSGRGQVKVRELTRGETTAAWKEQEDETLRAEMGDSAFDFAFFRRGLVEPQIPDDKMREAFDAQRPDDANTIVLAILEESGISPRFPQADEDSAATG